MNHAHLSNEADDLDKADMESLASGRDAGLNGIMERHAGKLFNSLFRCLQNEEDAGDAAQETFVRVYQNRNKFDPRHKFSTWLYTIATNLVKDRYRHRSRRPQTSLDAENETGGNLGDTISESRPGPSESLEGEERVAAVREAVGHLPEELRTPLILSEYEELSHAEIGKVLNCSAKAVETRIYRARQQLRLKLGKMLEAY